MKLSGALAAVAFYLACGPAVAQTPPRPSIITNPDWLNRPNGDDFAHAYPPLARELHLEGTVVVHCQVLATGVLSGCRALSEQPRGLGFAAAALSMADTFRMRPATRDGVPTDRGRVQFGIVFRLPPPAKDVAAYPVNDPGKVALARRTAEHLLEASEFFERYYPSQYSVPPAGVDPATFKAAVEALTEALKRRREAFLDFMAETLAGVMNEAELEAGLEFISSYDPRGPGGIPPELANNEAFKSFTLKFRTIEDSPSSDALADEIGMSARKIFCESRDCSPSISKTQAPDTPR